MERVSSASVTKEQHERLIPSFTYGAITHAYQPSRYIYLPNGLHMDIRKPKENPASLPFNEQIFKECYRPILADTAEGIPQGLVFSYYTTLREWMKIEHPESYTAIQKNIQKIPDKEYQVLGDPFLHVILPLLPAQDQQMLLQLGREAFFQDNRFLPKGLWLPETAVTRQTLQLAKEAGYQFVMLRDHQLEGVGSGKINKHDGNKNPVYQRLPNGGEIAIIHFDSDLSGLIAFDGDKTNRVEDFFNQYASYLQDGQMVITGVDLETYGHHKKGKEAFLRQSLRATASGDYSQFLQKEWHQPGVPYNVNPFSVRKQLSQKVKTYDTVKDETSWSCANGHNLGRWKGTCDCDHPSFEARQDKMAFYSTLTNYNNTLNAVLDEKQQGWRNDFAQIVLGLRTKILSGQNFLPDLQRLSGDTYPLYAAKIYTLLGFTSCGWFFGGRKSIERDLPKDMIGAVEQLVPTIRETNRRYSS